jgi:peptidoglycan-N-acetylglucosamine deacetylase
VVADGHEIAHHSWAHIPPATQSRYEEEADLVRANAAIERLTGRKARGYRSPAWELSENTIDLLLTHGFRYDSSLMGADYEPYFARRGDRAELGKPYHFGQTTSLIEMPVSWSLDDYPHFEFVRTPSTVLASLQPAGAVMQSWLDEFRYMKKTVDWGALTYTMHPYVIGRGHRMLALEGRRRKPERGCEGGKAPRRRRVARRRGGSPRCADRVGEPSLRAEGEAIRDGAVASGLASSLRSSQ